MNSFYNAMELSQIGFKSLGKNVLISRKASIYGATNITIGNNVRIDDFCILSGRIELGDFIHIAAYSALYGGKEGIYISDFVNVSSRVSIYSISDDYSGETMTSPLVPDIYKNLISKPVYIMKHVIIGSTSVILPGVVIAEGSALGSFSFVNRNTDEWSINAGIPIKKVKNRDKEILELERKFIENIEL